MFALGERHCCTKPLSELTPIVLSRMQLPMVHEGRYLACRSVAIAIVEVGTSICIEDVNDDVEGLTLYNFQLDLYNDTWLPVGTIMLIKEPHLIYGPRPTNVMICVNSPSDVVFVDETDEELLKWAKAEKWHKLCKLDFDELKAHGNRLFQQQDYDGALKYYDRALKAQPGNAVIHSNKAAALLALERYYEAYEETKKALDGGADIEKARYRMGKCSTRTNLVNWEQ